MWQPLGRHRQHNRLSRDEGVNLIPDAVINPLDASNERLRLKRELDLATLEGSEGHPPVYPVGTFDKDVTVAEGARD